jgi:hypothetical protein
LPSIRLLARRIDIASQGRFQVIDAGAGVTVDGHLARALAQLGLQGGRTRKRVFHCIEFDHADRVLDGIGVHGLGSLTMKRKGVLMLNLSSERNSAAMAWACKPSP